MVHDKAGAPDDLDDLGRGSGAGTLAELPAARTDVA